MLILHAPLVKKPTRLFCKSSSQQGAEVGLIKHNELWDWDLPGQVSHTSSQQQMLHLKTDHLL